MEEKGDAYIHLRSAPRGEKRSHAACKLADRWPRTRVSQTKETQPETRDGTCRRGDKASCFSGALLTSYFLSFMYFFILSFSHSLTQEKTRALLRGEGMDQEKKWEERCWFESLDSTSPLHPPPRQESRRARSNSCQPFILQGTRVSASPWGCGVVLGVLRMLQTPWTR